MTTTGTTAPARAASADPQRADPGGRRRVCEHWMVTPYLFLVPALVLLAVFFIWPAVTAVQLAFYDYRVVSPAEFVGFDNFTRMFADPRFVTSLTNSGLFLVGMLPILVGVPLLLAVLVNLPLRGIKVFRLVYYLPVVTSMVAVAVAWRGPPARHAQLAAEQPGPARPARAVPPRSGLGPARADPRRGLEITGALHDDLPRRAPVGPARAVRGGRGRRRRPWRRLVSVTVPMLRPYIAVVMVLAALDAMQVFTTVFVMTQGGPQDTTLTLGHYIYEEAFRHFNMGYASSMGLVLWAILVVFSLVSYRLTRGKMVSG